MISKSFIITDIHGLSPNEKLKYFGINNLRFEAQELAILLCYICYNNIYNSQHYTLMAPFYSRLIKNLKYSKHDSHQKKNHCDCY